MYIVVTDCGYFWNHNNPILKKYKDSVIVVCLNGQKVTDEYRCFVSPYDGKMMMNMLGRVPPITERREYTVLKEHSDELRQEFGARENVVFLTDSSEQSFYPFWVLADNLSFFDSDNSYHLCSLWGRNFYSDEVYWDNALKKIKSIFSAEKELFRYLSQEKPGMDEFNEYLQEYMERLLPHILNGIHNMKEKSYFDFSSMKYVPIAEGFNGIDLSQKNEILDKINFDISPQHWTLGMVCPPDYPSKESDDIKRTEQLTARIDGKKICNILREQRIRLAQSNNIPFESVECPSIGPCGGTCRKCDSEAAYLREKLEKIPSDRRVYPRFDVLEEMENDR